MKEEWKDIPEYEGLYQVSNLGRIKSLTKWNGHKYVKNEHTINNELKIVRIKTIDRDTMLELLNNGYDYKEISKILGIATGTVFNYIKKFKIEKKYI